MLFRYLYFDPFKFKKNSNSFGFQTPRKKHYLNLILKIIVSKNIIFIFIYYFQKHHFKNDAQHTVIFLNVLN